MFLAQSKVSFRFVENVHASGTARHLPTLLQAVELPAAVGLLLALHEIVIVGLAAVSDEVGRAHKRRRCGTNFLDLGDVVGHGGGVHQDGLVEAVRGGMSVFHGKGDKDRWKDVHTGLLGQTWRR